MHRLKSESQTIRFLTVGGAATLIDFGFLFLATSLGVPTVIANIISTGISFCFSFIANKNYTFKTHGANLKREIGLFVLVTLFGLWVIQSIIIGFTEPMIAKLVENKDVQLLAAKLFATAVTTVWNYVLYSRVVFTHKQK